MQGFLPLIFLTVSHHKENKSELKSLPRSLQVWLAIETDHGNDFLKPISGGPMTPLKFEYCLFSGEYEAICLRPWITALCGVDGWKNQGLKISWHCPFNYNIKFERYFNPLPSPQRAVFFIFCRTEPKSPRPRLLHKHSKKSKIEFA
jgi:hypothetical protein